MKSSGADISKCGRYRYRLWRRWGPGDAVLWVMLNPSTADAEQDDATIRRCKAFTKDWGCERLEVVNLFALCATNPKELVTADDPIGPRNDVTLRHMGRRVYKHVIAAWGAHGYLFNRGWEVAVFLLLANLSCLGVTKNGQPRHPLCLPKTAKPIPWERK